MKGSLIHEIRQDFDVFTENLKTRVEQLHIKGSNESDARNEAHLEGIGQQLKTMPQDIALTVINHMKAIFVDQATGSKCTYITDAKL